MKSLLGIYANVAKKEMLKSHKCPSCQQSATEVIKHNDHEYPCCGYDFCRDRILKQLEKQDKGE